MINHNSFYGSLAKKEGTITLSSNDQPSIGEEGNASGVRSQNWERFGSEGVGGLPHSRGLSIQIDQIQGFKTEPNQLKKI